MCVSLANSPHKMSLPSEHELQFQEVPKSILRFDNSLGRLRKLIEAATLVVTVCNLLQGKDTG